MIIKTCKNCRKVFKIFPYRLKEGNGLYCSKHCFHIGHWKNPTEKMIEHTKKAQKIAWNKRVGMKHSDIVKNKISENRKGKSLGDENPKWKGGKPKCIDCKKLLSSYNAQRCLSCNRKFRVGENHPNWVNGNYKKQDERNDSAYQMWVKKVKKRDGNKCKINNQSCSGYCVVHHILSWKDYPELRYSLNNGITLCLAHHPRKRAEEKRLIPFFQGLVSVSKEQF